MGILNGPPVFYGLHAVRDQYAAMERCEFKPVARGSQILAGQHGIFITIKGPCGDGHTMNYAEARNLRDWLIANVPEKKGRYQWAKKPQDSIFLTKTP